MNVHGTSRLYHGKSLFTGRLIQMTTTIMPLIIPTASLVNCPRGVFITMNVRLFRRPYARRNVLTRNFFVLQHTQLQTIRSLLPSLRFTGIIRRQNRTSNATRLLHRKMDLNLLRRVVRRRSNRNTSILRVNTTLTITSLRRPTRGTSRRLTTLFLLQRLVHRRNTRTTLLYVRTSNINGTLVRRPYVGKTTSVVKHARVGNTTRHIRVILTKSRSSQSLFRRSTLTRNFRRNGTIGTNRISVRRRGKSTNKILFRRTRTILAKDHFNDIRLTIRRLTRRRPIRNQIIRSRRALTTINKLRNIQLQLALNSRNIFLSTYVIRRPFHILRHVIRVFIISPRTTGTN